MSTLEITEGIQERTGRVGLKRTMQSFGEVDACHMGDRAVMGDNFTEYPIVRFKTQTAAETALAAIKSGQVFLDGFKLCAEWRGGGGRAVRQRNKEAPKGNFTERVEDDLGSRMLLDAPSGGTARSGARDAFAARDDRRDDRLPEVSSRDLLKNTVPKNASSRDLVKNEAKSRGERRRSPSRRKRRRSPSHRSPSPKKKRFSEQTPQVAVAVMRPRAQTKTSFGNLETAVSDNPLFKGRR